MDLLILQVLLLSIAVSFCQLKSQGKRVVPPTFLNVSKNLDLQQLLLEWDVSNETYNSEKQMLFNIQINQTGASNIVWDENYVTTLDKSNRPIQWRWVSKEPMECMSYAVRIRSLVTREGEPVSESWSDWTQSKEVKGMDIEDSKSYMFPKEKIVEGGSKVSFCCIGKKGEIVTSVYFNNRSYSASRSHRRVVFTAENVPLSPPGGFIVFCDGLENGAILFVTRPPGEPKDLSCETEDMVTLKCSWQPGSEDNLVGNRSIKFTLSDGSTGKIYCLQSSSKSCSFKIGAQTTYNLRLTARNNLGEKHTNLSFDVAHRVHPAPPYGLLVSDQNATAIRLQWKIKHHLELLCQIESRHPDGKVNLHSTTHSTKTYIVSGLQPYTKYTFRVRCGANQYFWKWSEWSESKSTQTEESAPSGLLDVWRSISPGVDSCNVTVFWKPFPGFHANGKIRAYEIFWEMLGERSGSMSVPASDNSTVLVLHKCSCNISILAKNSVNSSPPSVMVISAASENDHTWDSNISKEDTTNNTETGIYISWKPQSQFDGYIVDWCNHPRAQDCDFQWKKFGQNQSRALITSDAFTPGVQYSFRVYGSLGNKASLLEKKAKYLKELEPVSIPELHIVTVDSRSLKLTWDYDHLNESHPGFIRGYSVFVNEKDGNCSLEGFEQPVFQDGLVICKYTTEGPAEKTLTVKQPRPNKEYLIGVLAFSISPPNIMDNFLKEIPPIKKVVIPPDGSWGFQLLSLLMLIPLILLMCICFWRSDWVRNCCCPKIPQPHVTPIKVLQMYPKTLLAANDFSPNNIIVEEHKSQRRSNEGKPHYYNQALHAEMPAVETLSFGNITYFTNGSDHHQGLLTQEAESQKLEMASAPYKPLECFTFMSNPTILNYVSQKDVCFPGDKQGNQAGTVNPMKQSDYKSQQALGSDSRLSDASEEPTAILQ